MAYIFPLSTPLVLSNHSLFSPFLPGSKVVNSPRAYLPASIRTQPQVGFIVDFCVVAICSTLILVNQFYGSSEWLIAHGADPFAIQTRLAIVYCDSVVVFLPYFFISQILVCNLIAYPRLYMHKQKLARRNLASLEAQTPICSTN